MALYGSASSNLTPILFRGSSGAPGVNVIIHMDITSSMGPISDFYAGGTVVEKIQAALLTRNVGTDYLKYPNLYAYFDSTGRNPLTSFSITNDNGTLNITQGFMKGEATPAGTVFTWINAYANNFSLIKVNICTDVINTTTGGRLTGTDQDTEDVHGNLWSLHTTPNAISSGTAGTYGQVLSSPVRQGCPTFIITNSDEQTSAPADMINNFVVVNSAGTSQRTINGSLGELIYREYRVIALSTYGSIDGYAGIFFYGNSSPQPYGYVTFPTSSTFSITRSSTPPTSWGKSGSQLQDTLTLASETRGAIFKLPSVYYGATDNRIAFSNAIADFISQTI